MVRPTSSATRRTNNSLLPPPEYGLITLIGLLGKVSAKMGDPSMAIDSAVAKAPLTPNMRLILGLRRASRAPARPAVRRADRAAGPDLWRASWPAEPGTVHDRTQHRRAPAVLCLRGPGRTLATSGRIRATAAGSAMRAGR